MRWGWVHGEGVSLPSADATVFASVNFHYGQTPSFFPLRLHPSVSPASLRMSAVNAVHERCSPTHTSIHKHTHLKSWLLRLWGADKRPTTIEGEQVGHFHREPGSRRKGGLSLNREAGWAQSPPCRVMVICPSVIMHRSPEMRHMYGIWQSQST